MPLVVSGVQASHVVAGARIEEVTQFVELVMKDGEQRAKRNSVSHLCACLDTGLGSIDDAGVADLCAAQERHRREVARSPVHKTRPVHVLARHFSQSPTNVQ